MKLKHIAVACLSALALSACKTKSLEELQPTADQETINTAKEYLSDIKDLRVTDHGVIYYSASLPGNSRWATAHIIELSYRYSCEELRWYVERGMIVRMQFRGNSGTTRDYDLARCETEVPTDLYE
ncbi:hypothetical protein TW78_08820 [Vibrio coralliilyticus]|uniref:Lipoprotein n=1 Tax=Vibrio coralliilyticus TaxID=190893 RepID=A0A1V0I4J6_9VIBR|nr:MULTISPECIES: hypothetical protein [Vibrio]ARC91139.1 hypothetical protein B6A42_01920 [Vibrio coralliilyticus]EEX30645.1 hypothetical protein VIC_004941 [Vibrio coralliilyticus ATCC BAA-450]KJY74127.1 hypothetical protein TW78_08820 [Vibrio coralliilyticus]MCC2525317.1 hypothetical protein [Vibrio coralliilyticus]MCM5509570.1 hypothetical protein [Vibrio sp. SCSIO 43169]